MSEPKEECLGGCGKLVNNRSGRCRECRKRQCPDCRKAMDPWELLAPRCGRCQAKLDKREASTSLAGYAF